MSIMQPAAGSISQMSTNIVQQQQHPSSSTAGVASTAAVAHQVVKTVDLDKIYEWINELCAPSTRENALIELR